MLIHPDEDIGAIPGAKDHSDSLFVRSHFLTWQGEAPFIGRRALFWRLGGCNKGSKAGMCDFCDTDFRMSESAWWTIGDMLKASLAIFETSPFEMVVVSGGEPLIQRKAVAEFCRLLHEMMWLRGGGSALITQLETNGDYLSQYWSYANTQGLLTGPYKHRVVCSPKVRRSGPYEVPEGAFHDFVDLRCVISGDPDSPYHYLPANTTNHPRVWLSPMTTYKRAPAPGEVPSFWDDSLVDIEATRRAYIRAKLLASLAGATRPIGLSLQSHLLYAVE